jgi:hypothetical protein
MSHLPIAVVFEDFSPVILSGGEPFNASFHQIYPNRSRRTWISFHQINRAPGEPRALKIRRPRMEERMSPAPRSEEFLSFRQISVMNRA